MHSWHKGGYFTPDLPMKRTHLDTQWMTLQDLITQATGDNIFLTPPIPAAPPGLNRSSPMRSFAMPEQLYNEPYQPSPIRSLRSSALESFVGGTESPVSSFGTSQLGNSSPDPSAYGGRENRAYYNHDINGRSNFGTHFPSLGANSLGNTDFRHEAGGKPQVPPFGNFVERGLSDNASGNPLGIAREPWGISPAPQNAFGHAVPLSHLDHPQHTFNFGRPFVQNGDVNPFADGLHQHQNPIHHNPLGYGASFDPVTGTPYAIPQQAQQFLNPLQEYNRVQDPQASFGLRGLEPITTQVVHPQPASQSPWNVVPEPLENSILPVPEESQPDPQPVGYAFLQIL